MSKPTIYDIKEDTALSAPYFFSRDSMRCFGQTMRSFSISTTDDPRIFEVTAGMYGKSGGVRKYMGTTRRFYAKGRTPGKGILALSFEGAIEMIAEVMGEKE